MRNDESGFVDYLPAVKEEIQIDRPGTEARAAPIPAEHPLDCLEALEKVLSGNLGSQCRDAVHEPRLILVTDRIGFP